MPGLLPLADAERGKWLRSYDATYLQRDLGDWTRLADLMPFRRFQRLSALRSAPYSELAGDASLGVNTSRRYLEYLCLSCQAFLLPQWHTNLTSQVIKTHKVFWIDPGLWRHLAGSAGRPRANSRNPGGRRDPSVDQDR